MFFGAQLSLSFQSDIIVVGMSNLTIWLLRTLGIVWSESLSCSRIFFAHFLSYPRILGCFCGVPYELSRTHLGGNGHAHHSQSIFSGWKYIMHKEAIFVQKLIWFQTVPTFFNFHSLHSATLTCRFREGPEVQGKPVHSRGRTRERMGGNNLICICVQNL